MKQCLRAVYLATLVLLCACSQPNSKVVKSDLISTVQRELGDAAEVDVTSISAGDGWQGFSEQHVVFSIRLFDNSSAGNAWAEKTSVQNSGYLYCNGEAVLAYDYKINRQAWQLVSHRVIKKATGPSCK